MAPPPQTVSLGSQAKGPAAFAAAAATKGADVQLQEAAAKEAEAYAAYGPVRRWALALSTHPDFEMIVILLIFTNCLTLALYRPLESHSSEWNENLATAGEGAWHCGGVTNTATDTATDTATVTWASVKPRSDHALLWAKGVHFCG
jgi:hypothetical protein